MPLAKPSNMDEEVQPQAHSDGRHDHLRQSAAASPQNYRFIAIEQGTSAYARQCQDGLEFLAFGPQK